MRTIALALVAGALTAAPVAAQDIVVTLRGMEGRTSVDLTDLATTSAVPISQSECNTAALLDLRFTQIDSTRSQLHLFYGSNCEMVSVRNDTTDTSCTDLDLEYAINMNTQVDQQIPVSSLIDCTSGSSGTRTIYVLAVDNETSEVSGAGQKVSFPIAFDFQGPSAPTGFTVANGETAMTLSWEASSDQITSYDVFLVADGCDADGNVTTTAFDDPANPTVAVYSNVEGATTGTSVAIPAGTAVGTNYAVAIRGVDNAGNAGTVSSVQCATVVNVDTFWDVYCGGASASEACASSCSASPGDRGSPLPWVLIAGAVIGLATRRRAA